MNPCQKISPSKNERKERFGHFVNFSVKADKRIKLKESEKVDFAREQKKAVEYEGDRDACRCWSPGNSTWK